VRNTDCVQLKSTSLQHSRGNTLIGFAFSKDDQELLLVWKDQTMTCIQASGDNEYTELSERVYFDAAWFNLHDLITAGVWPEHIRKLSEHIEKAAALVAADAEREERAMYARLKAKYESQPAPAS
jgi:hypothetical protein